MIHKRVHRAVVASMLVTSACNPCDLQTEVGRILEGQTNVTHCGDVRVDSSRAELNAIVECMMRAIQERRPFRTHAGGIRGGGTVYLGRVMGSAYEVRGVSFNPDPHNVNSSDACAAPTFRIYVRSEMTTPASRIIWDCEELRNRVEIPPQPRYDPPRQVPSGQICPVL
jgi:hypothetical protein